MQLEKLPEGSIVISNANLELVFDEETRLLSTVKDKRRNLTKEIKLKFGGYPTVQFRNGAYLFKPDANREPVAVIDPIGESFEHKFLFLEFLTFLSLFRQSERSCGHNWPRFQRNFVNL